MNFKLKNCNILALQQQKEQRKLNKKSEEKEKNREEISKQYETNFAFPKIISTLLEKYHLGLANLKPSKKGAIYRKKENGHCEYYDYSINYMFYQFCHFFALDEKYINKENMSVINNVFNSFFPKVNIEYKGPENNCFYFYVFLIFFNKNDKNLSENLVSLIDNFLENKSYIHGTQPTSHDIVLLSIIYNSVIYKEKQIYFLKFKNLEKWFHLLETTLEIK
jgi:glutathione S-transferase